MMTQTVLALSFVEFFSNGWEWAQTHPGGAAGILVIVGVVVFALAGPAGLWPAATLWGVVAYGVLSLALTYFACCVAGSRGGGNGQFVQSNAKDQRQVRKIIISREDTGDLSVEIRYQGLVASEKTTWTRQNLDTEVERVCNDVSPEERRVDIQFQKIPAPLRYVVIEEFRRHGATVNEEVQER